MPLHLENLDDRTYEDLVEEALAMIPNYAPEWTNHNPSDPGITLIELFAYLTEMLNYRLNRVTDANVHAFLKLLNGPDWRPSEQKTLTEEMRETVLALRQTNRAVTCEDFEKLALAADARIARTRCVPRCNLESESFPPSTTNKSGHISVVVVPQSEESNPQPASELIKRVKNYLEPRRLLTTSVHVVGPRYVGIGVRLTLVLKPDALEEETRALAVATLQRFLHPLYGGADGKGWPFGRNVYVSEIYELLDTLSGVDYAEKTMNPATNTLLDEIMTDSLDAHRLQRNAEGQLVAAEILADELVDARIDGHDLTIVSPIGG
ncbi:MAG: baseplate J/gp47 family protein [Proteobacteria bacterium]|nr:baseplate J/gp47 family protein [Pseudomonadota bacterium]